VCGQVRQAAVAHLTGQEVPRWAGAAAMLCRRTRYQLDSVRCGSITQQEMSVIMK
jgi:hypothetical protein